MPGPAAFLQAAGSTNDHDLGLFAIGARAGASTGGPRDRRASTTWRGRSTPSPSCERIRGVLTEHGALVGASDHGTTKALYAQDPDGIEFEVSWLVPADLLDPEQTITTAPLHLEREIERYGAETRGGIGVSVPTA